MQKNSNSNKWFFNFNFVNISHFTYAFVSKKISLFNKSFSYSHPVIWYCRCSMALLSFFRDKREVDIFSSSFFVIKFRGYLEKSHARQNAKFSCFHSNFDANTISLNQVINLITWLVDLFCDFAKGLKARANTKHERINETFPLSSLRYEMADSVNIKRGTFQLCLFCLITGKFRMFKSFCHHWRLQCSIRICSLWIVIC